MRKDVKNGKSGGRKRQAESGRRNLLKFREANPTPHLSHGISALLRSGQVPPSLPYAETVKAEVDSLLAESVSDLGGETELTAQRKIVLESQRLALLVLKLAGRYLLAEGLLNKRGRPHALLSVAATYANSARLNALALGLERKPRRVGPQTLEEHLEQIAEKESQNETQDEN